MNKPIKTIAVALAAIASMSVQQTEACTRATYIGPDNTVITGRMYCIRIATGRL